MTSEILLNINNKVAYITFNRPDQHNAIAYEGWLRLIDIADQIKSDPEIRVAIFSGSGSRAFSAGADIKDFDCRKVIEDISSKFKGKGGGKRNLAQAGCNEIDNLDSGLEIIKNLL